MIEHWYLACMILVTSPFDWHHILTFNLISRSNLLRRGGPQFSKYLPLFPGSRMTIDNQIIYSNFFHFSFFPGSLITTHRQITRGRVTRLPRPSYWRRDLSQNSLTLWNRSYDNLACPQLFKKVRQPWYVAFWNREGEVCYNLFAVYSKMTFD